MSKARFLVFVALVELTACGGDGSSGGTPVVTAPTPTPSPTPTSTPTPTSPPTASFVSPSADPNNAVAGTITDPEGDGTVAGVKINGNETISLTLTNPMNGGASTYVYSNTASDPFTTGTKTFTSASGVTRTVPVAFFTNGKGTRIVSQISFFSLEQGATAAGGVNNSTPIRNVLVFGTGGGDATSNFQGIPGIAGDPTPATTRLTEGSYSYTGEAIGSISYLGPVSGGSQPQYGGDYIGQATVSVNYSTGVATTHIVVSQYFNADPNAGIFPFTLDFTSSVAANGSLTTKGATFSGAGYPSPANIAVAGQTYSNGALEIGGTFYSVENPTPSTGFFLKGSFVAAR